MRIWSEAFAEEQQIPSKCSRDGDNVSPPLRWSGVPGDTRELALLFENLTPQTQEPFPQWVVYGIAPGQSGLPEGFQHKRDPAAPADVVQGTNGVGNVGYDGPQGTAGRSYRFRFRLLALNQPLELVAGADRDTVLAGATDRLIGEAAFEAVYERPR